MSKHAAKSILITGCSSERLVPEPDGGGDVVAAGDPVPADPMPAGDPDPEPADATEPESPEKPS